MKPISFDATTVQRRSRFKIKTLRIKPTRDKRGLERRERYEMRASIIPPLKGSQQRIRIKACRPKRVKYPHKRFYKAVVFTYVERYTRPIASFFKGWLDSFLAHETLEPGQLVPLAVSDLTTDTVDATFEWQGSYGTPHTLH
jgi:hypothetical protein